uniref:Caspase domain-containing protein n=1 Tax=Candidatus Kentrum sp. TUN TaxID=2126343 RepID=A0A450ZXG0_9GAMM|nr:MAG: Caspase domain-containing protein [Candidatus Kentron sp. TUN]
MRKPIHNNLAYLKKFFLFLICIFALSGQLVTAASSLSPCSFDKSIETDGYRRLALIIGVGEYRNGKIEDLQGPPNDARNLYNLLTRESGKGGYGFPEENVCILTDEQATTGHFKDAFERGLIGRVRSHRDVAVFFYAGHGSQMTDCNGDEPDGLDETFMFHDARSNGVTDFSDDEFNHLLTQLNRKTENVTVILDSCNAGTATRSADAGTYIKRYSQPQPIRCKDLQNVVEGVGDGSAKQLSEGLGTVIFSAASDGTSALERKGSGIFTNALLKALGGVGDRPLTYAQVARQIPTLVSAESYQIPYFHGDLNKPVFGNTGRTRPMGWDVFAVMEKTKIRLSGPPLPGIGPGAELRVYDGAVTGADTRDPGKAKATVVLDKGTGTNAMNAIAHTRTIQTHVQLNVGDLAILVRPSDETLKISVRLRPSHEPGGIPERRANTLRRFIESDPEANLLVTITEDAGDFELSVNRDGQLVLRGPENESRMTFERDAAVPRNLWQHARQRALKQLRGEGGRDFTDNQTLRVQLVPLPKMSRKEDSCPDRITWKQARPNEEQIIPLCHTWRIKVTLDQNAPKPLLIGALILSTDGSIYALPSDGRRIRLSAGESVIFDNRGETFVGAPPLDVQDRILVFGTREKNPVDWHLLTETARTRSASNAPMMGLYRELSDYLQPGTRGQQEIQIVEPATWTMSSLTMQVVGGSK